MRPCAVFADLFAHMVGQAHRGLGRKLGEAVLPDRFHRPAAESASSGWARFSAGVCGAKLHVVYDPDADRPIYAAVTAANVNDITAAKAMPIEAGATYVFDLGYYDYGWWAEARRRRLPHRHPLQDQHAARPSSRSCRLPAGSAILSDRIGLCPRAMASSRNNPFQNPVREVRVSIETGKVLRILTNDLDAPAEEIADLYKRRWPIELFFRWVKQTLKIRHFLGTSENAVRIQIAVALIAFLLLRLAQAAAEGHRQPARLRPPGPRQPHAPETPSIALLDLPRPIVRDPRQLALALTPI